MKDKIVAWGTCEVGRNFFPVRGNMGRLVAKKKKAVERKRWLMEQELGEGWEEMESRGKDIGVSLKKREYSAWGERKQNIEKFWGMISWRSSWISYKGTWISGRANKPSQLVISLLPCPCGRYTVSWFPHSSFWLACLPRLQSSSWQATYSSWTKFSLLPVFLWPVS